MRQIGVGLFGYGTAGQVFHAPLIAACPGLSLRAVGVRSGEPSKLRYPEAEIVHDPERMVKRSDIELVVVATPNPSHYELARLALDHGKHVVVDKPFTVTVGEAEDLIGRAQKADLVLSVFHNRRWDGDFLTVRRIIEQGMLGRVVEFESHFDRYRRAPRPNAWREAALPGSGIFYDLAPHLIDQAAALFGLPDSVWADIRTQRDDVQADDAFEIVLSYGRMKATLKAGMLVREPGPRFLVYGTEGSFVKEGMDPQEARLKEGGLPDSPDWGKDPEANWGTIHSEWHGLAVRGRIETLPGQYPAYYNHIYEAITTGVEPAVKSGEALAVMRLMELALESARTGRQLPFPQPEQT